MSRSFNPLAPRRALPERTRLIKAWVRDLYGRDEDVVVSLTELACREDGCPDIETIVGIMRPGRKIETLRVHKAIDAVTHCDIEAAAQARTNHSKTRFEP